MNKLSPSGDEPWCDPFGELVKIPAAVNGRYREILELPVRSGIVIPEMGGVETLRELRRIKPKPPAVMLTRRGTIDGALSAIKAGASDYIPKPPELARLMLRLKEAFWGM